MSTVNGWTKGFPTLDGDYFCRVDDYDKNPVSVRIESDSSDREAAVYEFGCPDDLRREYEAEDYEYLGPFTASDCQQLAALRVKVRIAIPVIEELCRLVPDGINKAAGEGVIAALREALGDK